MNSMSSYILKLAQYRKNPDNYGYLLGAVSDICDRLIVEKEKVYEYNPSIKGQYEEAIHLKEYSQFDIRLVEKQRVQYPLFMSTSMNLQVHRVG